MPDPSENMCLCINNPILIFLSGGYVSWIIRNDEFCFQGKWRRCDPATVLRASSTSLQSWTGFTLLSDLLWRLWQCQRGSRSRLTYNYLNQVRSNQDKRGASDGVECWLCFQIIWSIYLDFKGAEWRKNTWQCVFLLDAWFVKQRCIFSRNPWS